MKSLRILHVEDDPSDVALVQRSLTKAEIPYTIMHVDSRETFVQALEKEAFDLIISDFQLPSFDGWSALEIVRAKWPEVPFILVSGTLGEDQAVDSLKRGATDYVLKDRLSRLAEAVRRAIKEVRERADRGRLEAQFIEAQKMEVVGQLAGGVAHDFNNILAVIMGYSDLLMAKLEENSALQKDAQTIRHAAERAAGLTRQLLVFSRKQTIQAVVLDLNAVVVDMEKMLGRLIDANVELAFYLGRNIGRIKADSGYVGQVLMNLVVNARDAMPNGGKITVETADVTVSQTEARAHPGASSGDFVMLSVGDTGTGMTDEVKAHMFEAFFTTKPKGKGTGLGLATCQTIVQQCGGHIAVSSELGRGTTFRVYFPRVQEAVKSSETTFKKKPMARGTETLLVVEDEPAVRQLACRVLEAQGYHVISATNGQDGLHAAREHKGVPIKLVITDVIMPEMGGKVMAEWLKSSFPDLKILYTSGYTDDALSDHGVLEQGVSFLPKPYNPASLARSVRELLDSSGPPAHDDQDGTQSANSPIAG
jgi:two-component system, cell cycle sensor histidine kinase and response regulator CckA